MALATDPLGIIEIIIINHDVSCRFPLKPTKQHHPSSSCIPNLNRRIKNTCQGVNTTKEQHNNTNDNNNNKTISAPTNSNSKEEEEEEEEEQEQAQPTINKQSPSPRNKASISIINHGSSLFFAREQVSPIAKDVVLMGMKP